MNKIINTNIPPTPRTDAAAFDESYGNSVVDAEFARQLERELAEANHLRERAESGMAGAASRMRAAQDMAEAWEKKYHVARAEINWTNRTAFLVNPLHEILEEMDSRGGNAIQRLAAYIRACDPERKAKAIIAFRDDLECYDRKLAPTTHPETPVV